MEVYTGKAAALEKLAKKHRGAVEGEAQGLWEGVVKARENLARAKRQSQALSKQDPSQVQAAEKDRWLSELQLISFRQDEREASSAYCTQVCQKAYHMAIRLEQWHLCSQTLAQGTRIQEALVNIRDILDSGTCDNEARVNSGSRGKCVVLRKCLSATKHSCLRALDCC